MQCLYCFLISDLHVLLILFLALWPSFEVVFRQDLGREKGTWKSLHSLRNIFWFLGGAGIEGGPHGPSLVFLLTIGLEGLSSFLSLLVSLATPSFNSFSPRKGASSCHWSEPAVVLRSRLLSVDLWRPPTYPRSENTSLFPITPSQSRACWTWLPSCDYLCPLLGVWYKPRPAQLKG